MENSSSRDRLLEIIKLTRLSKMEFAEKIGVSAGAISHITSSSDKGRKAEISENLANRIIATFPSLGLRYDWLMHGNGAMSSIETSGDIQPSLFDMNSHGATHPNAKSDNNELQPAFRDGLSVGETKSTHTDNMYAVENYQSLYQREVEKAPYHAPDVNSTKLQSVRSINDSFTSVNEQPNDIQKGANTDLPPQIERIVMFYSDGTFVEYKPKK